MTLASAVYSNDSHNLLSPKLKVFGEEYLYNIFEKAIQNMVRMETVCRSLEDRVDEGLATEMNIKQKKMQIRTFVLHYLSRGTTIPILCKAENGHRSPFDYIHSVKDSSTYYRGDGASTAKLFLDFFNRKNSVQVGLSKYRMGVVKPEMFVRLMQKTCKSCQYEYRENLDQTLPSNFANESTVTKPRFIDISKRIRRWTAAKSGNLLEIGEYINQLQIEANEIPETEDVDRSHILGGVIRLSKRVGIYIFFKRENSQNLKNNELIREMIGFKGNIGAFPEMIDVKAALVEQEFLESFNFSLSNEPFPIERIDILEKIEECIVYLQQIDVNSLNIYRDIIIKFLNSFKKEQPSMLLDRKVFVTSLDIIRNITANESFHNNLQNIYLAIEQIIFLSLYFEPSDDKLEESLKELFCSDLKDDLTIFAFNSGMTSYDYLIDAVYNLLKNSNVKKTRLNIVEGSYYEVNKGLRAFLGKDWDVQTIKLEEINDIKISNLLLLDLYPNDVTLKKMQSNPVEEFIQRSIQNIPNGEFLTVILDTSTTLFSDLRILNIKESFNTEIKSNKLNLILVSSLAKFYSCGLDKYTGGVVALIGGQENKPMQNVAQELKILMTKDSMSDQAKRFFSLLFSNAYEEIKIFYEKIKIETHEMYEYLKGSNPSLNFLEKSEDIPMIGMHLDNYTEENFDFETIEKIVEIAQFQLYKQAQQKQLQLLVRASFPFPHSAITECSTALRLIVGLDMKEDKEKYLEVFREFKLDPEVNVKDLKESLVEIGSH